MANEISKQAFVIRAPKGSITNKAEVEAAAKALGVALIFLEYKEGFTWPPQVETYNIVSAPTITEAK